MLAHFHCSRATFRIHRLTAAMESHVRVTVNTIIRCFNRDLPHTDPDANARLAAKEAVVCCVLVSYSHKQERWFTFTVKKIGRASCRERV